MLYNISYQNVLLYSAVIPEYRSKKKEQKRRRLDDPSGEIRVTKDNAAAITSFLNSIG